MKKAKEKKIQSLKKKRIWPSIIALIFFNIFFFAFLIIQVTFFMEYSINGKIESDYESNRKSCILIERAIKNIGWEKTFNQIQAKDNDYLLADSICITDYNNYILYNSTNNHPDFERKAQMALSRNFHLYLDTSVKEDYFNMSHRELLVSYKTLFNQIFNKKQRVDSYSIWARQIVAEIPYWIEIHIAHSDYKLLQKYTLHIRRQDLIYALTLVFITFILISIPCIFLILNIISTCIHQNKLDKYLFIDILSEGFNWLYLCDKGQIQLRKFRNRKKTFWLISLTMNKYNNYCTCYGSRAGETILEDINSTIRYYLSKHELYARNFGADFALLLQGNDHEIIEERINLIINDLINKYSNLKLSFSSGVYEIKPEQTTLYGRTYFKRHSLTDINELYINTTIAQEHIQPNDINRISFYTQSMLDEQLWEHHVEERMNKALENKEFKVFIQPKYSPMDNKLGGGEALVRWVNDEDGLITPNRFIPIFEKNGFILKLDDYMLRETAKLQTKWLSEGRKIVPLSVNITRIHFTLPNLAEHICEIVDEEKTPHNMIELEITESAFFDDKAVLLSTVRKLQSFGFKVSMDDFGSGYSSLNSLKDLPLDVIKLDAEFFRGEDQSRRGETVIKEAIKLAQELHMNIVAEGIENKQQVDFLAELGCDLIQGYYFAKPMPSDEYVSSLEK